MASSYPWVSYKPVSFGTIAKLTAHLPPDINFDNLPIPFRAVATDLETGKMIVFNKGSLHKAVRASIAAPGVFAPIEIDGKLLSDGGLVRNLPVDIARDMGADIIIAVNIGTPLMPEISCKPYSMSASKW
jgi:NTE family protein